jgi:hypothetical protein
MRGIILLLAVSLFSCKSHKPKTTYSDSLVVSILPRDTAIIFPADSAFKAVQLDVIDGKVSIGRTIAEYHGNKSKVPEIFVNDGILTVRSGTIQYTVHVTVYDTKERKATHSTEIRYENVLTKWQSFQIIGFRIFLILIAVYFAWKWIEKKFLNR